MFTPNVSVVRYPSPLSVIVTLSTTPVYAIPVTANLSVTSGAVTISEWVSGGVDYQNGDTLSIDTLGGTGSGS